jgi:glycosyltransferase domain-containing protein
MLGNRCDALTVVMPTRNRSALLSAQLRFFKECRVSHPIVVADSSDPAQAIDVSAACANVAEYRTFDSSLRLADKLVEVIRSVRTFYIALVSDDDIHLPHAIDAAMAHLQSNPSYVAAHGYSLSFASHNNDFDLSSVLWFTPSIEEDDPLRRHHHLMRRYQPFYWAVFRTEALSAALTAAQAMSGIMFREITLMNTAVLQGKIARLPVIHSLRRNGQSHTPIDQSHPFFWFIRDANSFFAHYKIYRDALAKFIRDRDINVPRHCELEQLLDIIHATWLGREVDVGMCNHAALQMLGDELPPIRVASERPIWQPPASEDCVRRSEVRSYVWRKAVLEAEPRHEITITVREMDRVERQLDAYGITG